MGGAVETTSFMPSLTLAVQARALHLRGRGNPVLARCVLGGGAPLVLAPLASQRDLYRGAPIDVSAADRVLDLAPEAFPQPAPFDHQFDATEGEVVGGEGRQRVGPLRPADGLQVEPGHQPVNRDL